MKNLSLSIVIIVPLILSGCALAARSRAKGDMELSKAEYQKCLEQNSDYLSKCEALKRAYEADMKAYRRSLLD